MLRSVAMLPLLSTEDSCKSRLRRVLGVLQVQANSPSPLWEDVEKLNEDIRAIVEVARGDARCIKT